MEKSLVVILLLAGLCEDASCQTRKYFAVQTSKNWTEARSYCREKYTDLVTVHSLEEQQQILNVAKNGQFWIGLYRDSDNWQWSNGDAVSYTKWTAGTGGLFCATADAGGSWGQSVCHDRKPFMCYNETSNITEKYTLISTLKTWAEAQQYCRQYHADLVSINSTTENEYMKKKAPASPFWIGLFNNPWKWTDGGNSTFQNWNTFEPNGADEKCVLIYSPNQGKWEDWPCSLCRYFVCYDESYPTTTAPETTVKQSTETTERSTETTERPTETTERPTETTERSTETTERPTETTEQSTETTERSTETQTSPGPGLCEDASCQTRKYSAVQTSKNWTEARSYCREKYTDLVTVHSLEEQQQILNVAKNGQFWIGLYRDSDNWQWSNGDAVSYTKWKAGTGGLFCATADAGGSWDQSVCHDQKPFMCYNETSNITEKYTLIGTLKTWAEAQQYCRQYHTDLVSIKSASENEDIKKKAPASPFWIGLFNNPWKWTDEGNSTFQNWNTFQPNGADEKCVLIYSPNQGKWEDWPCSLCRYFVCYDESNPTTKASETTAKQSSETTEQSTETTKRPTETTERSTEATERSTETTEQSTETTERSTETTERSTETTERSTETTERPTETTGQSTETTERSTETTERPTETTEQSTETIERSTEATERSTETTEQSTETTERSTETTERSTETTERSTETTERPTETTERPTETTGQSTETTERSTETTERPTETTEQSTETIERPSETTERPSETTERSTETTERSTETTERPTETTGQSTETTERPTETTGQSTETTERSTETTERPTETTEQSTETIERPSETTERPSETTERSTETTERSTETTERPTETQTSPGPEKRRQVLRIEIKAPEGMDPEEPKIRDAILAQLQEHFFKNTPMEGTTLRWIKKDRKIFHKQEEEEEEEGKEMETCSKP